MVMRDSFDLHILDHADAKVKQETSVTGLDQDESGVMVTTASGETLRARYLIGADGANSRVARLVGLRRKGARGSAIEAEVRVGDGVAEEYADTALFLFGAPPQGYLWAFPKAEHLSVGIAAFRRSASNVKKILRREMSKLGIQVDDAEMRGHPLPVHLEREPLRQGRVLLVGDAAGLMDPLSGEGIRHAIDSGRLAAESILKDTPQDYSQRVHQEIGKDLLWGRRWAQVFYRYPRASFELAVRNPLFVRDFLRLFTGEVSYRRMAVGALPNLLCGLSRRLPVRQRMT
jgi:flavin-dependent dehydrogenase